MHPHLIDLAAAHIADLLREAAARCRSRAARHPVTHRVRATIQRAIAALHRATPRTTSVCRPV